MNSTSLSALQRNFFFIRVKNIQIRESVSSPFLVHVAELFELIRTCIDIVDDLLNLITIYLNLSYDL